ncbi:hypothetical protein HN587_00095 [Candidatus Woesearchaeota archaeon]|jgi:cytosolic 5'-nucleotidase 3|nr:hypothetical protein [Candidatus Woesearchaeota archaeon]
MDENNSSNILIPNPDEFEKKIKILKSKGKNHLHIIADFDKTLTKFTANGKKNKSSYAHIRDGNYLTNNYTKRATDLVNIYYPIEIDPTLDQNIKNKKMEEWWDKHYALMEECNMSLAIINDVIEKNLIQLRDNCDQFFSILIKEDIPCLILSAGFGNLIKEFFKSKNLFTNNIHLISNFLIFDDGGKAIDHTKPLIHTFNKNEAQVSKSPHFKDVKNRKNVILLGDSLGDLKMTEGFDSNLVLKIGFLNDKVEEQLDLFKAQFDLIILNDGSFCEINKILRSIL